jgi:hypothetical protein
MKSKKTQISSIEVLFLISFFFSFLIYLTFNFNSDYFEEKQQVKLNSLIDSIYFSEKFRDNIFNENISNPSLSTNWQELNTILKNSLNDYELKLITDSNSKLIFSCSKNYEEYSYVYFVERILFIKDNNNFEKRIIRLGVCI